MIDEIAGIMDEHRTIFGEKHSFRWPTGRENPAEIKLERNLSGRLRALGYGLIADRPQFRDPHFQGGYQIVSSDTILAGRDFDLSLMDVAAFVEQAEQKRKRKRA